MADEVLGFFDIKAGDQRQKGYITTFYDEHGKEVRDPREAAEVVGFVQEGQDAGRWIRFQLLEDDQFTRIRPN